MPTVTDTLPSSEMRDTPEKERSHASATITGVMAMIRLVCDTGRMVASVDATNTRYADAMPKQHT
jgi:hypothetical protein